MARMAGRGTGTLDNPQIQCRFYPECIMCGWLDEMGPNMQLSCQLLRPMILRNAPFNYRKTYLEMAMVERGHRGGIDMVLNDWAHKQFAQMMLEYQVANPEKYTEREDPDPWIPTRSLKKVPWAEKEEEEEDEREEEEEEEETGPAAKIPKAPPAPVAPELPISPHRHPPVTKQPSSVNTPDTESEEPLSMSDSIFECSPNDSLGLEEQFILEGAVDTMIDSLFHPTSPLRLKPLAETMKSPLWPCSDSGYQSRRESMLSTSATSPKRSPGGFSPPKCDEPKTRSTVAWGSIVEELSNIGPSPVKKLKKAPDVPLTDMTIRDAIIAANKSIKSQAAADPKLAAVITNICHAESKLNASWNQREFHKWAMSGGDLNPNVSWDPAVEHMRLRGLLDEAKNVMDTSITTVVETNDLDKKIDEDSPLDPIYLTESLNLAAEYAKLEMRRDSAGSKSKMDVSMKSVRFLNNSAESTSTDRSVQSIAYLNESTQSIMESLRTRGLQSISVRQGILLDESLLDKSTVDTLNNSTENLLNNSAYLEHHQRMSNLVGSSAGSRDNSSTSVYVNDLLNNTVTAYLDHARGPRWVPGPLNESFNPPLNSTVRFADEKNTVTQNGQNVRGKNSPVLLHSPGGSPGGSPNISPANYCTSNLYDGLLNSSRANNTCKHNSMRVNHSWNQPDRNGSSNNGRRSKTPCDETHESVRSKNTTNLYDETSHNTRVNSASNISDGTLNSIRYSPRYSPGYSPGNSPGSNLTYGKNRIVNESFNPVLSNVSFDCNESTRGIRRNFFQSSIRNHQISPIQTINPNNSRNSANSNSSPSSIRYYSMNQSIVTPPSYNGNGSETHSRSCSLSKTLGSPTGRRGSTLDDTLSALGNIQPETILGNESTNSRANTDQISGPNGSHIDAHTLSNTSGLRENTRLLGDSGLNSTGWGNTILLASLNLDDTVGTLASAVEEAETYLGETILRLSSLRRQPCQDQVHKEEPKKEADGVTVKEISGTGGILIEINANPTFVNNASGNCDQLIEKFSELVDRRQSEFEEHITAQLERRMENLFEILQPKETAAQPRAQLTPTRLYKPNSGISLASLVQTMNASSQANNEDNSNFVSNWARVVRKSAFRRQEQPVYANRKIKLTRFQPRKLDP